MQNSDYLISENPMKALVFFSLPMIIGNLFQQAYTMADSAIVGRLVGENALAAVGAAYSLTNIFICIAIGGGIGASVIVSQYFGRGSYGKLKKAVYTALISFLLISGLLGGFGLLFSRKIMIALNTPAEVLDMSVTYLKIYFLGLPFLFMYNVLSSMFNALGKSRIPLYFLIFLRYLTLFWTGSLLQNFTWMWRESPGNSDCTGGICSRFFYHSFEGASDDGRKCGRHFCEGGTASHDKNCSSVHFTAVYCIYWNDAGAVCGEQFWSRSTGWFFCRDAY